MALVPAGSLENLEGDFKELKIWSLAVAVNPGVLEVKDNRKLRSLNRDDLETILQGRASNWSSLDGIDLDLTWVRAPAESPAGREEAAILRGDQSSGIPADSLEEQIRLISKNPGAAGLMTHWQAEEAGLKIVKLQIRERKQNLRLSFILEEPKRAGRVGGISSIIINTVYMIILTILVSAPIGVGAAIYLTEYATQGRLVSILRLGTETLAGIPSIIFGLFGFIVFVSLLGLGIGLISGILTITLMILPTVIRTSEEAIKAVPKSVREGSLALGASRWQTIYKAVLPGALPGILTGVILGIGRAVGETAALLFTMGFDYRRAETLFTSARMLSVHLYQLVKEGISFDRAFATATILIIIVMVTNLIINSRLVRRRFS